MSPVTLQGRSPVRQPLELSVLGHAAAILWWRKDGEALAFEFYPKFEIIGLPGAMILGAAID